MNKILNFIKQNYKYIIFFVILFIINSLFMYKFNNNLSNGYLTFLIIAFCILELFFFMINYKMRGKSAHSIFLFFSIILGVFYVFFIPMGAVPDEAAHFRRAYEISDFHVISDKDHDGSGGRVLPNSINNVFSFDVHKEKYKDLFQIALKKKYKKGNSFQRFGNTSLYSPICYAPQVMGIWLGRLFHLPMIIIAYLARLFNLAVFIAIVYLAIKHIPISKYTLVLISMTPISMQAAASCQADTLTNATAFALLSFVLYKINNKKKITRKESIIASSLAIIMSMCKIVYIPICLLLYLIPNECFESKKQKYIRISLLAIITIIINLIWLKISSSYLIEFQDGVNSMKQVRGIINNPIHYILVLFSTYESNGVFYSLTSIGSYLSFFNIKLSDTYIMFYLLFIIFTFISENDKKKLVLNFKTKIMFSTITIICILLISTSLYVQWTAVGESIISGIQGRYFIPLMPMILLLLNSKEVDSKKNNGIYVFLLVFMINVYALMSVIAYYI